MTDRPKTSPAPDAHGPDADRSRTVWALSAPLRQERLSPPICHSRILPAVARHRAVLAARFLAGDDRVRLVYLFGSAAEPDAETVGDVDLAIKAHPPLSLPELLALRADAVAQAGGELDLVDLDRASVVLSFEVARDGECLYAADPDEDLEFRVRAKAQYLDFKPFLDRQWELAGQRLAERMRHGPQT